MVQLDKQQIENRVFGIIRERYQELYNKTYEQPVTLETRLGEDMGFDSLGLLVLQVELEDTFQLHFDYLNTDLEYIFSTAGHLCTYIWELIRN